MQSEKLFIISAGTPARRTSSPRSSINRVSAFARLCSRLKFCRRRRGGRPSSKLEADSFRARTARAYFRELHNGNKPRKRWRRQGRKYAAEVPRRTGISLRVHIRLVSSSIGGARPTFGADLHPARWNSSSRDSFAYSS